MPYFSRKQDGIERSCKVLADIFCALLIGVFSVVSFGLVGGLMAFVILEAALLDGRPRRRQADPANACTGTGVGRADREQGPAAITERILHEARLDEQVAAAVARIRTPDGAKLARDTAKLFKQQPDAEWRDHIEAVARKRSSRS